MLKDNLPIIKKYYETIRSIIDKKDLISVVIIAEYGGYYFDTTTRFTQTPNLPQLEDIKVTLPEFCRSEEGLLREKNNLSPWIGTDIWSFASAKPGHPTFLKMLNLFSDAVKQSLETNGRIMIVGVPGLLLETLMRVYGIWPKDFDVVRKISWSVEEWGLLGWKVPELCMEKINAGTWRPEVMRSPEVYEELKLRKPGEEEVSNTTLKDQANSIGKILGVGRIFSTKKQNEKEEKKVEEVLDNNVNPKRPEGKKRDL